MKKLIYILTLVILSLGCEDESICPDVPWPKGDPNDIVMYEDPISKQRTVIYTYVCWDEDRMPSETVIKWVREKECGEWTREMWGEECY